MNWIKAKIKWILTAFGILGIATAAVIMGTTPPILEHLQLKAPKERILIHKTANDIRCDKHGKECKNHGLMKKYWYVTNNKLPAKKASEVMPNSKANWTEDISARMHNKFVFRNEKETTSVFLVGYQMTKEIATGDWFDVEIATTTIDAFNQQTVSVLDRFRAYATVSTFYPDPSVEVTTVDGTVNTNGKATWTAARDPVSGDVATDDGTSAYIYAENIASPNLYRVSRGYYLFDTETIPDTDTISSATLSLYGGAKGDNYGDSVHIIQTAPVSNTALAVGDFSLVTFTSGSSMTLVDYIITGYNDFALNATGLTWISKTGITKLGAIMGYDLNNTDPSTLDNRNYAQMSMADVADTTEDPKLVVTHSSGWTPIIIDD